MKLRLFIFIGLTTLMGMTRAQTPQSSYFLEGATYRHQLNPAFMGERNYISMPVLGNVCAGTNSNLGLTDLIYKFNDPTGEHTRTTFMSTTVNREEFLSKIHPINRFYAEGQVTLLSAGFYGLGGFNTIEVNTRTSSSLTLPYELFNFMKTGMEQEEYVLGPTSFKSSNYLELSLGHSLKIGDKVTVGAKLKYLLGLANVNAKVDEMEVLLSSEKWAITANGTLDVSVGGGSYNLSDKNKGEIIGLNVSRPNVAGYGGVIDLGVTYKPIDDLQLSAAITDLGAIAWTNNLKGATRNETFVFEGFNNISLDEGEGGMDNIDSQFRKLSDDLMGLSKFYYEGKRNRYAMLTSTVNVGAEYSCPFYRKLSLGVLSSTHINDVYSWSRTMVAANVRPLSWVEASLNYAYSPFGSSFGWMLNLHPKGVNFFVGTDYQLTKLTPQYVPTGKFNTNLFFGLNFTFGKRRGV